MVLSFSLATACNSNTSQNASSTTNCRPIQHAMGETCVPPEPKRVVVMAGTEIEPVVALGIIPVGASIRPAPQFMKERLEGVTNVGWPEPNLETILSLKPDIILSAKGRVGHIYDKLSQIAPTVLAKGGSDN
ncbi:MAG: ABC transporter substrate-binding protein, partial [Kamptonema sp. SIO4C4]|nr:ABC transporter substrate-binding protein [Kamptonema sp. SIO4C4]